MKKTILAILTSFFLFQCGSVPATYYYQIDYQMPVGADKKLPFTLGIGNFSSDVLYQGDRIVYRHSPYEVQFYHYRRWIAPPRKLVAEAILEQAQASGHFKNVVSESGDASADYILQGHIKAFEEWDEAETWYGNVHILFELTDAVSGEMRWQGNFSEKTQAKSKAPVAVVEAISESLKNVGDAALSEIAAKFSQFSSTP